MWTERRFRVNTQGIGQVNPLHRETLLVSQQAFVGCWLLLARFWDRPCVRYRYPIIQFLLSAITESRTLSKFYWESGNSFSLSSSQCLHDTNHSKHFIEDFCVSHCTGLMLWQADRVLVLMDLMASRLILPGHQPGWFPGGSWWFPETWALTEAPQVGVPCWEIQASGDGNLPYPSPIIPYRQLFHP